MPSTDPRLSDAACLAASDVDCGSLQMFLHKPNYIIRDGDLQIDHQVIFTGPDTDLPAAERAYKIAFFRKIITAALNIN